MDTVIKTVNFIRANVLNHREFVAFLEEVENKYGEIIYLTNVRWLSRGSVLKLFFDLLNEIKLSMEKKGRNIEELNYVGWTTDLAFLVDVAGHLIILTKSSRIKIRSLPICITTLRPSESSFNCWKTN
jgi:hypothetical protein